MSTTALVPEASEASTANLLEERLLDRSNDRCDRCGAEAFFLAVKQMAPNGEPEGKPTRFELLFCGHHGKEKTAWLHEHGFTTHDQTERINEVPSPSANHEDD
jgi:hypothetical protein